MKRLQAAILSAILLVVPGVLAHTGDAEQSFVAIEEVLAGGAAEAAGLRPGDRIVAIGKHPVASLENLRAAAARSAPGDTVVFTVRRDGALVERSLTFGEGDGGQPTIGVTLRAPSGREGSGGAAAERATAECLAWVERTYRIKPLIESLDLDLADDHARVRACVERDTRRMSPENAVRYCDNILKGHCSGLDLLTELAEAQMDRCEAELAAPAGVNGNRAWKTCARDRLFDEYSMKGQPADLPRCRTVLEECGDEGARETPSDGNAPSPASGAPPAASMPTDLGWMQWGGPDRSFRAPASGLAADWPEAGPPEVWSRDLGEGNSAILFAEDRLYTLYRHQASEVAICLDARSGKTIWEQSSPQELPAKYQLGFGKGPRSTPALAGKRLFTVGNTGRLNALDRASGEVLWSRELWSDDLAGSFLKFGYASSPAVHRDLVIVPVGGEKAGLIAFEQAGGKERWRTPGLRNSYSSPQILEVAGEAQVIAFMAEEIIGVDAATGKVRWSHPHVNQWKHNISMPVMAGGDMLFFSSPQAGARGIRITRQGDTFRTEEIWSERRVQFYHGSSARMGDWIYGSTGTASPAFMTAVNIRTGEIAWKERGIARANCLEADGKLVILDEDGVLYLAGAGPESLTVHARTQLLDGVAWTVPTLVGKTLYARDNRRIVAVDLGVR